MGWGFFSLGSISKGIQDITCILCRRFELPSVENLPVWPSPPPSFLSFFLKAQLLTTLFFWHDRPYEIPDKQKNKLMWQSHFFIFRRLKNDVTCVFISNTFISNTSNLLSKEHYYYKIHTYIINEKQRLHSPRSSFIDNPSNVDDPSFLQENLDRSYDFPKISTPYK